MRIVWMDFLINMQKTYGDETLLVHDLISVEILVSRKFKF